MMNQSEEAARMEELERAKKANNPWVRIVDNCEMNASNYVGGKDVTRMR